MNRCPCCGSVVDIPVIVDLDRNIISINGDAVKLRPKWAEIIKILLDQYPATVPYDRVFARLYGADGGPENPFNSLSAQLVYLRRAIGHLGLRVASVWGVGLRLEYLPRKKNAA